MGYTVGEVARWSGVTVRTLHHYEHIALLSPAGRSSSGYRVYDDADLERLQQILFYRELGFSLDHIAAVLASPRDAVEHLAYQRGLLLDRIQRLQGLVAAIEQAMEAKTMGTTPTPAERFAALNEGKTKVIIDAGDGTVLPTMIRSWSSTSRATCCGVSCPTRRRPFSSATSTQVISSASSRCRTVAMQRSTLSLLNSSASSPSGPSR